MPLVEKTGTLYMYMYGSSCDKLELVEGIGAGVIHQPVEMIPTCGDRCVIVDTIPIHKLSDVCQSMCEQAAC